MKESIHDVKWGLDHSMGFALGVASRRMSQLFGQRLREFGLSPEQWSVLHVIAEQEGLIQKEIAGLSFKDKPTITRILDVLEEKGLITRKPGESDRRSFRLYATEKGKELALKTEPLERGVNAELADRLGQDAYYALLAQLKELTGFADILLEKEQEVKE
ncbi:Organic hydroperoxide resistance transcriptional regulator [compost metagenome]